jgi:tRNA dimethylallyltransferase
MFRQGLRKEVTGLVERFGWGSEALTGIGYREFKAYDEGTVSMSHVKRTIVQDTLHFAKRQRTWFKRNPAIHWVEHAEDSFALIDHFLEAN